MRKPTRTSSAVAIVRTTSTSFISGTGLKKCSPINRSGRFTEVKSSVTEIEDVFDAKIASFFTTPSSDAYIFFFSSTFSMIASITISQSAKSALLVVPLSRARIATFCSAVIPPFSTGRSANFASDFSIPANPLSRYFCSTSSTVTSNPAIAQTCAMPDPINPHPRTPTFLISITLPRKPATDLTDFTDYSESSSVRIRGNPRLEVQQRLHNHRDALTAANAGRRQTIFFLPAPQLVKQSDHQPRSRCTQRMSQRNGSAIHIHLLAIQPQLFFHREILCGEGFVHLNQVHVLER